MGKALTNAVKIRDCNDELSWDEFGKNHPEITFLLDNIDQIVDIDFSSKVRNYCIHYFKGTVASIRYEFNETLYFFPNN